MTTRLTKAPHLSSWRKISLATWQASTDPTVHGAFEIDATPLLDFVQKYNTKNPDHTLSLTHIVTKALAIVLAEHPEINGVIRRGTIYLRNEVDIFLQVAVPSKVEKRPADLSGALIRNTDKKSLMEISQELKKESHSIREEGKSTYSSSTNILNKMPVWLLKIALKVMSFLVHDVGVNWPKLGMPLDPFGSAMITSVGSLGVPSAFPPLVGFSRVPLILCVGMVVEKPWVVEGQVVARPVLDFCCAFDHRFIDGFTGAKMFKRFKELMNHPEQL